MVWLHAFLAYHLPALVCIIGIYLFVRYWIIPYRCKCKYRDFKYIIPLLFSLVYTSAWLVLIHS